MTLSRQGAESLINRREWFVLGATPVLSVLASWRPSVASWRPSAQDSLPAEAPAGRLYDPTRAGRPQTPTTERDSDPAIQALEKRLRCTCGCGLDVYTCRTTDFSCTVSPAMHQQVLALLDRGMTDEQVVATFVQEHGQAILMAPPKRGFNLAAYFVPGIAIVVASAVLFVVLRRWTRAAEVAPAVAATGGAPDASPDELVRLRRELDEFSA
jgi:cytochrome c-type biogenesis protein CcmH